MSALKRNVSFSVKVTVIATIFLLTAVACGKSPSSPEEAAALRELQEEAGLNGKACGIVSVRTRVAEEGGAVFVGFRIRCDSGEPVPDYHEVDAAQFFGREELLALDPVMELSRQIGMAVLAAPGVELVETHIPGRSDATYKAYMIKA